MEFIFNKAYAKCALNGRKVHRIKGCLQTQYPNGG